MRELQRKLSIARGERPAEQLFKNANLVNVLSGEIYRTHVAVDDGRVVGLGDYKAKRIIDLKGAYLAPSLIDGHFHVESSMLTTREFARAVVPHGTGAVVIDPHEYANVLGLDGIRYVLESSKNLPVDFFIMLPSCVPATTFETAGARLTAEDLKLMIGDERIAGVAELMNYPGVYLGVESELAKIEAGKGKNIDGHAPGLRGRNLNAYVLAGVQSDHESTELAEAQEKLRLGMHVLLREGSTERNLATLVPLINSHNAMNCSFATDDKLAGDLVSEGHIDHCVRKAITDGLAADGRAADGDDQHGAALPIAELRRHRPALLGGLHRVRQPEEAGRAPDLQEGHAGGRGGQLPGAATRAGATAAQHDEPALQGSGRLQGPPQSRRQDPGDRGCAQPDCHPARHRDAADRGRPGRAGYRA